MKQNVTLKLDKELIKKGKVIAAKNRTSLSRLLSEFLKRIIEDEEFYELSRKNAFELLDKGFHSGGTMPCSREELHER